MNRLSLCVALVACAAATASDAPLPHFTGEVLPTPQKVTGDWRVLPLAADGFTVEIAEDAPGAFTLARDMLLDRFAALRNGASDAAKASPVKVVLGTFNDARIKQAGARHALGLAKLALPRKGHITRVRDGAGGVEIVAAGVDVRGTFYAAMTLLQQMGVVDGAVVLKCADMDDWPHWQRPYAMEYGPAAPSQLKGLAVHKVDGYAIQHRFEWRDFRPDLQRGQHTYDEQLAAMAEFREETGIFDFMLLLHIYAAPSDKYEPLDITNEAHVAELAERCRYAASRGFTHIMILADDWTPQLKGRYVCMHETEKKRFGDSVGRAHGYLMRRLHEALEQEHPGLELSFCPAPYSLRHLYGGSKDTPKPHMVDYLRDMAEEMPDDIPVVWTGRHVCSPDIAKEDFTEYSGYIPGQPSFLWDNSNGVDNPRSMPRFTTTRYEGFASDSNGIFYLNAFAFYWPWQRPFVLSAMDALWNPGAFDVDASFKQAVEKIYGPGSYEPAEAFRRARAEMKGSSRAPEVLAPLIERADAALKQLGARGIPTQKLRADLDKQRGYLEVKPSEAKVPRFEKAPTLDGKLDDPCWDQAARLGAFAPYGAKKNVERTEVLLGYDDENLYVAMICHHQGNLPTPTLEGRRDGSVFTESDSAGFMLQPEGHAYGHMLVDYAGNIMDERNAGGLDWDPAFPMAIHEEEKAWTLEVAVPFEELRSLPMDADPKRGTVWRGNFYRFYAHRGETSSWSDTHGNRFHNTAFFGVLEFE